MITKVESENLPLGIRWTYYEDGKPTTPIFWSYERLFQECEVVKFFF